MKIPTEDRLSELPDSLILEILSLMPSRDVVRTTILSDRWKDLWTTIPCLDFELKNLVRDRDFIHQTLLRWKGINIRNFKIDVATAFDGLAGDLDLWVGFATQAKVENICLNLPFDWCMPHSESPERYWPPHCIYSYSSIKELWLIGCKFEVKEKVQWDNLKTLFLHGRCLSEDVINQIVSSAPRLETLDLRLTRCLRSLNIESDSLKSLSVAKHNENRLDHPSAYAKLAIKAPKLEYLHLGGNAYGECKLLVNAPSLTCVLLRFYEHWHSELEATLTQILPSIRHVEELTLSPCAFKMLGVMHSVSPFPNVKKLTLDGGPVTPEDVAGLVRMFPQVETLVVDWILDVWYLDFLKNLPSTTCECSGAKSFPKLRTAEIVVYVDHDDDDPSVLLLESSFWREHATMLQKTMIQKGEESIKGIIDLFPISKLDS